MNIQLKRFGTDLPFTDTDSNEVTLRARTYIDRKIENELPESYIMTAVDVSQYTFVMRGQRYQCQDSRQRNTDDYYTIITPIAAKPSGFNLDAVTE